MQMPSHPFLVSSGETVASLVTTVEGDLPKLQRTDCDYQIGLLLLGCLAHDLGRPSGRMGPLTLRLKLCLAGVNALLAAPGICSGYWNRITCLEQERTSRRPWGDI